MYAIFRAKGKQFRAAPDTRIKIPSMDAEPGDTVTFDEVLLAERDGEVLIGTPALGGASVSAEIVGHGRGDKIIVYKMKRRKGYRKKQGHRQGFTEIRIVDIALPGGKPKRSAKGEEAEEPAEEPTVEAAPAEAPEAALEAPEASEPEAAEEPEAEEFDITDAAQALAEEHELDLSRIEGTGKDGRILKGDVEKAIKAQEGD